MRMGVRRLVSWAAVYAVALHAVLLGTVPVISGGSVAGDPFSIICHAMPSPSPPPTRCR